jgi:hypothetical protein
MQSDHGPMVYTAFCLKMPRRLFPEWRLREYSFGRMT